jgi:pyruvate/2-oxoglutarate dehydrogenase complex dihydrolipoamide dehydrogenase (E3) component
MNPPQSYEVIVLGGGKGGKTLATELGNKGVKTALIERSAEMIGGACINVACIPTKTLIASARGAQAARTGDSWVVRNWSDVSEWTADTALAVLLKDLKATYNEGLKHNVTLPFNALSSTQLFNSMGKEKPDAK